MRSRTSSQRSRYALASGTQVREEDFGLLFYTMKGPRLYFLASKKLLAPSFFDGKYTLDQWLQNRITAPVPIDRLEGITNVLEQLSKKGVIIEC